MPCRLAVACLFKAEQEWIESDGDDEVDRDLLRSLSEAGETVLEPDRLCLPLVLLGGQGRGLLYALPEESFTPAHLEAARRVAGTPEPRPRPRPPVKPPRRKSGAAKLLRAMGTPEGRPSEYAPAVRPSRAHPKPMEQPRPPSEPEPRSEPQPPPAGEQEPPVPPRRKVKPPRARTVQPPRPAGVKPPSASGPRSKVKLPSWLRGAEEPEVAEEGQPSAETPETSAVEVAAVTEEEAAAPEAAVAEEEVAAPEAAVAEGEVGGDPDEEQQDKAVVEAPAAPVRKPRPRARLPVEPGPLVRPRPPRPHLIGGLAPSPQTKSSQEPEVKEVAEAPEVTEAVEEAESVEAVPVEEAVEEPEVAEAEPVEEAVEEQEVAESEPVEEAVEVPEVAEAEPVEEPVAVPEVAESEPVEEPVAVPEVAESEPVEEPVEEQEAAEAEPVEETAKLELAGAASDEVLLEGAAPAPSGAGDVWTMLLPGAQLAPPPKPAPVPVEPPRPRPVAPRAEPEPVIVPAVSEPVQAAPPAAALDELVQLVEKLSKQEPRPEPEPEPVSKPARPPKGRVTLDERLTPPKPKPQPRQLAASFWQEKEEPLVSSDDSRMPPLERVGWIAGSILVLLVFLLPGFYGALLSPAEQAQEPELLFRVKGELQAEGNPRVAEARFRVRVPEAGKTFDFTGAELGLHVPGQYQFEMYFDRPVSSMEMSVSLEGYRPLKDEKMPVTGVETKLRTITLRKR